MAILPKEHIGYGLGILADQLLNSIPPAEGLARERKVVIEEIQKASDDETSPAEYFFGICPMARADSRDYKRAGDGILGGINRLQKCFEPEQVVIAMAGRK